ncbi:MAG: glycoside hydrolase [Tannerella sp.]|nr:glycoside hydrolase [Tannerella sp.]
MLYGCVIACFLSSCVRETGDAVSIDPERRQQTLEGWGSSLCWWAGQVGNWDEQTVDEILDLIVSPDKLNMNIFRYNIGGGDDPSHLDGHMTTHGKGKRCEMEGFKSSPDAPYDWNADAAQRRILLKIKEKRPDVVLEAFSNSPPYWMTYSGCAAGAVDPADDNLKPAYYDAFCDYLIEVCRYYRDTCGITFHTLEPFNESSTNSWKASGDQEGCHFHPATQIELIRRLYPKLKASGLSTVISAPDETDLERFLTVVNAYVDAGDVMDKVGQLNTHTYGGTPEQREEVRALTGRLGKPFWQSETGLSCKESGLPCNLKLAEVMFNDLRVMQAPVWLDWQMVEEHNDTWCQFQGNFREGTYRIVKNLYVRMQITRFFKQGYTLLETPDPHVLAAISPDKREIVVALLNTSEEDKLQALDFQACGSLKQARLFRTSATEDCLEIESPDIRKPAVRLESPQQSLSTLVIQLL